MVIIKGNKIKLPTPCVLAMGKFESIHLGHRSLITEVVRLAQPGLASAMVAFEPHPYRVLSDPGYKSLFAAHEREYLVRGLSIDYLLEYPFNRGFAALSPIDFCHKLYEELQARIVVVGEGYRFGHKREGTADTLRQVATTYNAQVYEVAPHVFFEKSNNDNFPVGSKMIPPEVQSPTSYISTAHKTSTSTIRALISANKLAEAEALLGYPFFIMGKVTPGRQLGRSIGFPTLNIYPPEEKFLPTDGVYVTRTILNGRGYNGVTNIGLRPTVETAVAPRSVETHVLGYEGGELYGTHIRVEFMHFIRPERQFESLDALKTQIEDDYKSMLVYLQGNSVSL